MTGNLKSTQKMANSYLIPSFFLIKTVSYELLMVINSDFCWDEKKKSNEIGRCGMKRQVSSPNMRWEIGNVISGRLFSLEYI